jgi:hypothetical protein
MEDEKLPKTIEDGVSSHFERAQDIDPAIEKRQVTVTTKELTAIIQGGTNRVITFVRIVRKIDTRLMPFTVLIYLLCYMDRSNIGMP